jgi:crossover junction endodeoxyribonuclease RusA
MNSLTFVVFGLPAPQGSKRHMGNGILVESSKAVTPWRTDCKHAALACIPHDWDPSLPMALSVVFRFKRPAGQIGKKGVKPSAPTHLTSAKAGDVDKLLRSTFDSLTGVAFDDDRQVVSVNASKRYCTTDEPQGAIITITPIQ